MEDKGKCGQDDTELKRVHLRRRRIVAMETQHDLRRSCTDGRRRQNYSPNSTRRAFCGVCGLCKDFMPEDLYVKVQL
jgi:hypothetical protein